MAGLTAILRDLEEEDARIREVLFCPRNRGSRVKKSLKGESRRLWRSRRVILLSSLSSTILTLVYTVLQHITTKKSIFNYSTVIFTARSTTSAPLSTTTTAICLVSSTSPAAIVTPASPFSTSKDERVIDTDITEKNKKLNQRKKETFEEARYKAKKKKVPAKEKLKGDKAEADEEEVEKEGDDELEPEKL